MAAASVLSRLERIGQGVLRPEAGLAALSHVLRRAAAGLQPPLPVVTVNPFKWDTYLRQMGTVPALYAEVRAERHGGMKHAFQ